MGTQIEIASARPLVVIVDDDPAIRSSLAFSLQTEGFSVRSYASGTELLGDDLTAEASCLVIDYQLPGMNGLDLVAELRRRQVAAPAILITTHPSCRSPGTRHGDRRRSSSRSRFLAMRCFTKFTQQRTGNIRAPHSLGDRPAMTCRSSMPAEVGRDLCRLLARTRSSRCPPLGRCWSERRPS